MTFLPCDPGWCVHKSDVQNKSYDKTHTSSNPLLSVLFVLFTTVQQWDSSRIGVLYKLEVVKHSLFILKRTRYYTITCVTGTTVSYLQYILGWVVSARMLSRFGSLHFE